MSLFANCRYSDSRYIQSKMYTVRWDFALGMEIRSLFANCRYIRSRYYRVRSEVWKSGKSLDFIIQFSRSGKSFEKALLLE